MINVITIPIKPVLPEYIPLINLVRTEALDFAKSLGIPVSVYSDIGYRNANNGEYHTRTRSIVLNNYYIHGNSNNVDFMSRVLLHEIIHWSGNSLNLGRKAVIDSESKKLPIEVIATEEITAEIGAKGLLEFFGIDGDKNTDIPIEEFIAYYENKGGDIDKAIKDAEEAVNYLISKAFMVKAA